LPIVAGAGDGQSAGLGANITEVGKAYLNLGTAMVSGAHAERYVADRAFRTLCSPIVGAYVLEEVLGGGSRSALWCQIVADVNGKVVKRASTADATNLGAGILAAAAVRLVRKRARSRSCHDQHRAGLSA
jgi:sugar (pentulose or hexulose) kinase